MNNKGFGILNILIFAIFAVLAILIFYSFITSIMGFIPKGHIPNYENEYSKYFESAISADTTLMSNSVVTSYDSYDDIEETVSSATERYITNYYSNIYENDPLYIKITALQVSGYINDIKDINNDSITCTGYTKVVKNNNRITYNSYIKCGDSYTTKGYVSRFDSQGL